jgi:serine/threonine protein kinase
MEVLSNLARAPEIIMGCEFDFAIDMWSFGCIIYEIITSSVLFKSIVVQMNFCKAAALCGTTDFSIFKKGLQYKKYILKDKYIYMVSKFNSRSIKSMGIMN